MKRTTTTTIWTCDRCRGPMEPDRGYSHQRMKLEIEHYVCDALGNGAGGTDTVELCTDCVNAFQAFMKEK